MYLTYFLDIYDSLSFPACCWKDWSEWFTCRTWLLWATWWCISRWTTVREGALKCHLAILRACFRTCHVWPSIRPWFSILECVFWLHLQLRFLNFVEMWQHSMFQVFKEYCVILHEFFLLFWTHKAQVYASFSDCKAHFQVDEVCDLTL